MRILYSATFALSCSLFCGLALPALAQAPFEQRVLMPGALDIHGAAMDDEGNYYFASVTEDNDIQVTRLSATGEHVWTNVYPFFTEEGLYGDAIRVNDDGIVVVGYTLGAVTNSRDGLILHIDLDGNLVDAQRIDVLSSNALHYLGNTSDGGFIASGRADMGTGNQYDMLLAKLDGEGTMLWSKTYGSAGWDWGYQPIELADGGFAVVGYADELGTGFSPSGYVVRTDALGNEMWARSVSSGIGVDELYSIAEAADGSIYVGGRSLGFVVGGVTAFITKLTSTGDHVWTRFMPNGIEVAQLVPGADGSVNWLAHPQFFPGGGAGNGYDIAWGKFAADGTLLSAKYYGTDGSDNGMALFPHADGSYSIVGFTNAAVPARWDAQLIVTDANSDVDCNALEPEIIWMPATAIVAPFTSTTGSGFTAFPYTMGQQEVAVSTYDPCCVVAASFTSAMGGSALQWTFTNTGTTGTYAWAFGDGQTSSEASPTHTYAAAGVYTVCLTTTDDCGSATACATVDANTTGITDASGTISDLRVFPVPANDRIVLRAAERIGAYRVLNAEGRLVATGSGNLRTEMTVDVDRLPQGLYTIEAQLANGAVRYARVVVAR